MAGSGTEIKDVLAQMTHIAASGMTTMRLSGEQPTSDSTDSGKERKGFTGTALFSPNNPTELVFPEPWFQPDSSDWWKERIVELWEDGTCHIRLKRSSTDGSNGPSQKEAEPSD